MLSIDPCLIKDLIFLVEWEWQRFNWQNSLAHMLLQRLEVTTKFLFAAVWAQTRLSITNRVPGKNQSDDIDLLIIIRSRVQAMQEFTKGLNKDGKRK